MTTDKRVEPNPPQQCSRCEKPSAFTVQAPTPWDISTCRDHLLDAIDDVLATGWAARVMVDGRWSGMTASPRPRRGAA